MYHDPDPSEFTEAEPARKGGSKPTLGVFSNWIEESNYIIKQLKNIDYKSEPTVLLHRDWRGMRKIHDFLSTNNIESEILNENSTINFVNGKIKICTLSSVKGLEFDNVLIVDVNDNVIPFPTGFEEEEDEIQISTERRLLYTSMTRARERLYLLSSGNPSRYLSEIDKELVETVGI